MPISPIILNESELMPFFTVGQRKILRKLAQTIADEVVAAIVVDPSVLEIYLDDIVDVDAPSPADNDSLTFDTASSDWVPEAISPSGGGVFPVAYNISTGSINAEAAWEETLQYFTNENNTVLITIPLDSGEAWSEFAEFDVATDGTSTIAFEGEVGDGESVEVNSKGLGSGNNLSTQYGKVTCKKIGPDLWLVYGDVELPP